MLSALADPTRRQIFETLVERPQNVRELAEALPVSRPAVSQHLRVLREAGLVTDRRDGTRRIHSRQPRRAGRAARIRRADVDGRASRLRRERRHTTTDPEEGIRCRPEDQTEPAALEPIRRSVVVALPLAEAFALFTDGLDGWWPLHTHSIAADTFEGRVTRRVDHVREARRRARARAHVRRHRGALGHDPGLGAADPVCDELEADPGRGPVDRGRGRVHRRRPGGPPASTSSTAAGSGSATARSSARATARAGRRSSSSSAASLRTGEPGSYAAWRWSPESSALKSMVGSGLL